ncbi:hypothetical protein LCGC14_1432620 [marine sediment metagenome]|uniref:Uncharacterized protein n=1 Tax=marine sediment metagenome TaxID=412755 RepID=A0A0F9MPX3_9ZZZZ
MSEWRPDGRENLYPVMPIITYPEDFAARKTYEAGADAILEALRMSGQRVDVEEAGATFGAPLYENSHGFMVFIPDEVKE